MRSRILFFTSIFFLLPAPAIPVLSYSHFADTIEMYQEPALEVLYEQAMRYIETNQFEAAIALLEAIYRKERHFKDVVEKLSLARKRMADRSLNEKIAAEYAKGLDAYKAKDWPNAVASFEKALGMNPRQREMVGFLEAARKNLLAAVYYEEGVQAQGRNDLKKAMELFQKAQAANPKYQDLEEQLQKTNAEIARMNKESQALYANAIAHMQSGEWEQAVEKLEKIPPSATNYSDVLAKLTEAKVNRVADLKPSGAPKRGVNLFYVGGAFIALIALPLAGFLIFSPSSRARALALSGNFGAAAAIYEDALKARPDRMSLYKNLAELYLRMNRRDKQAMQVFKTVVRFDLRVRRRAEIEAVVSQNYVGDADVDLDKLRPHYLISKTISWTEHLQTCLNAVEHFDEKALEAALERAALDLSHPVLLTQVIMPLMQSVGQQWAEGTMRITQERMASVTVRNFLGEMLETYAPRPEAPVVVAATPKGQMHEFGALAAGIVAASEGWRVLYLGADLPADEIAASAIKVGAKAVALSLIWPEGNPDVDSEMRRLRRNLGTSVALVVGGRAAESHSATLSEIDAIRIHSAAELISFREVLEKVRLNY